jgi:hypothetical protein
MGLRVARTLLFYNLDLIISLGWGIKSAIATQLHAEPKAEICAKSQDPHRASSSLTRPL